jgi:FAD/FMN-containing dehydrogenase
VILQHEASKDDADHFLGARHAFKERLRGQVVCPSDNGYDAARKVERPHRPAPAFIAFCANDADVLASVRFAREHELLVAVRGGGHNVAAQPSAMMDW